jgi:hypothetical protein
MTKEADTSVVEKIDSLIAQIRDICQKADMSYLIAYDTKIDDEVKAEMFGGSGELSQMIGHLKADLATTMIKHLASDDEELMKSIDNIEEMMKKAFT